MILQGSECPVIVDDRVRSNLRTHDLRVSCEVTFNLFESGVALYWKVQPFHYNVINLSHNVALLPNSEL